MLNSKAFKGHIKFTILKTVTLDHIGRGGVRKVTLLAISTYYLNGP